MMRIIIVLFCLISLNAAAQNNGYVILNYGDTLRGRIKLFDDMGDVKRFQEVHFYKGEQKMKFEPSQIKGYKVNKLSYVTKDVGEKRRNLVFFQVLVKGYCTLYESKVNMGRVYDGFGGGHGVVSHTFYLQREGEELHPVLFIYLKQGKDLYFIDNVALTYDIKTGKYKKDQLDEIVRRYNSERQLKEKE